jgi:membrane protease subunit HflK
MYIDSMREMYGNVTKVLVDTTKSNSLLYLPLDKIVAQVSAESAQAASGQTNTATTPTGSVTVGGATGVNNPAPITSTSVPSSPSASNADKRDGLRSRDREAR